MTFTTVKLQLEQPDIRDSYDCSIAATAQLIVPYSANEDLTGTGGFMYEDRSHCSLYKDTRSRIPSWLKFQKRIWGSSSRFRDTAGADLDDITPIPDFRRRDLSFDRNSRGAENSPPKPRSYLRPSAPSSPRIAVWASSRLSSFCGTFSFGKRRNRACSAVLLHLFARRDPRNDAAS